MWTYIAFFKFIDSVDAVVENAVSRVSLVADEADKDVGIRAAPTYRPSANRHPVFYHCGDIN